MNVLPFKKQQGFTFVEIAIVISILSILLGLITVNLLNVKHKASLNTSLTTLISDFRSQQIKAMSGAVGDNNTPVDYGIYFQSKSYILFRGAAYVPNNPSNFLVNLADNMDFEDILFPSSQIIFQQGSGEVSSFISDEDGITLLNSATDQQKIIKVNRYGVVIAVN